MSSTSSLAVVVRQSKGEIVSRSLLVRLYLVVYYSLPTS